MNREDRQRKDTSENPQAAGRVWKPVNRFGRKGGRGVRPWLITMKIIGVAMLMGGLICLLVMTLTMSSGEPDPGQVQLTTQAALLGWVVLPGISLASLSGIGLASLHGGVLFSRRWLQVKIVIFLVVGSGLWMVGSVVWAGWRDVVVSGGIEQIHDQQRAWSLVCLAGILVCLALMVLGRHKFRLGQRSKPGRMGQGSMKKTTGGP